MTALEFSLNTQHNIGRPRFAVTRADKPELDGEAMSSIIAEILKKTRLDHQTRTPLPSEDRMALLNWWKQSEPGLQ